MALRPPVAPCQIGTAAGDGAAAVHAVGGEIAGDAVAGDFGRCLAPPLPACPCTLVRCRDAAPEFVAPAGAAPDARVGIFGLRPMPVTKSVREETGAANGAPAGRQARRRPPARQIPQQAAWRQASRCTGGRRHGRAGWPADGCAGFRPCVQAGSLGSRSVAPRALQGIAARGPRHAGACG